MIAPPTARLDAWGDGGGPDGVNGSCISFRQTGGCSGTGPRQPSGKQWPRAVLSFRRVLSYISLVVIRTKCNEGRLNDSTVHG
jgi:hypothetical protein